MLKSKITASVLILFLMIISAVRFIHAEGTVFETKCSKCHALKNPDNYTKAEWKKNVERMAKRAGLTQEEIKIIIDLNKK